MNDYDVRRMRDELKCLNISFESISMNAFLFTNIREDDMYYVCILFKKPDQLKLLHNAYLKSFILIG